MTTPPPHRPVPPLEVAVYTVREAHVALTAGAHRVECNGSPAAHGCTPSPAMVATTAAAVALGPSAQSVRFPVVALLRPAGEPWPPHTTADVRPLDELVQQGRRLLAAGARGLVFGSLDSHRRLDERHTRTLADLCAEYDAEATVHRAIEECDDPAAELCRLPQWGVRRVLLAGFPLSQPHLAHAPDRATQLLELASLAAELRLIPALCGGIRAANVRHILGPCLNSLPATARIEVHSACTDAGGRLDAAAITALLNELQRSAVPD